MSRKKISPNNQIKNTRRTKTQRGFSLPTRYRFLMVACGMCLIIGFFFAARQHFASIDFSMKNSTLRKMSEELESDKRRLLLAKEIALSPTEIKKAAQKIGFKAMPASAAAIFRPAEKQEKPPAEEPAAKIKQANDSKKIEPTAAEKVPAKKIKEEKPAAKIKKESAQAAE